MPHHVVLICEDSQHEYFARHFLYTRGYTIRDFDAVRKTPCGRGSGEQFVREAFLDELRTFLKGHKTYELIVVCDADKEDRLAQWQQACKARDLPWPDRDAPVALFFPARNIETWIQYLRGEKVDEITTYRKLQKAGDCQDAVDALAAKCQSGDLPSDAPPSLRRACEEYAWFRAATR